MLEDPGVVYVSRIYRYYKKYGHGTVVMPASWRNIDELRGLAGVDRATVAPQFLLDLEDVQEPMNRILEPVKAAEECQDSEYPQLTQDQFLYMHNQDACAVELLSAGIRAFCSDTDKLEEVLKAHPAWN